MRLFVAAWPPDEMRDEIVEWAGDQLSPEGVRWLPADRLHVTLAFAGEVDEPAEVEGAVRLSRPVPHPSRRRWGW